jgi:hypothetical protein
LAEGDPASAEHHFSDAARMWNEVGAPYEAAMARRDLARAHRAVGSEHQAALEFQAARAILDRIEGTPVDVLAVQRRRTDDERKAFRREGDYWSLEFAGQTVRVRDLKGMRYLARLLAEPGRELHVLDLAAAEGSAGALGDAGEHLDDRAKQAYRRRLAEIDEDIEEAGAAADDERAARAEAEREFLVRELSRAFGLGGRSRRAGSASERARAAVTRALRQAIARVGEHHPLLGEHLDRTIRTGTYCAYLPDPRLRPAWTLA